MLSIRGIYENGEIRFLEKPPREVICDVIITFLENRKSVSIKNNRLEGLLSDLDENDFKEFLEYSQNRGQDWFTGRRAGL